MDLKDLLSKHERYAHRAHQLVGVDQLVKLTDPDRTATDTESGVVYRREIPGVFALLDDVGAGKTKQCVDATQVLWLLRELDTVLVLTPGFARSTWADADPELGEVAKHAWPNVPNVVHEFHGSYTDLDLRADALHWIVTNYEFVRRSNRRDQILKLLKGRHVWMICDESWCVKGNSDQTRAAIMIRRKRAERITILNGTPLSDGKPSDLYYQFSLLDPSILGCDTKTHFKSKYCTMGGVNGSQVVGYHHLEELNARIAPYVLSRKTRDCFDLPPMLDPITIEARLSDASWKLYRAMRDEMVAWLGTQTTMAKQGIVKALRLAQICSGYLGGLEDTEDEFELTPEGTLPAGLPPMPEWLRKAKGLPASVAAPVPAGPFDAPPVVAPVVAPRVVTKEIGREKLDAWLDWFDRLPRRPERLILWCRWRVELERLTKELEQRYPTVMNLKGGQTDDERRAVKKLLAPGSRARGAVAGIVGTGGASLTFSGANTMGFMSNDPALIKRTQSIGRIERPGQEDHMLVFDVVAAGPKGQKTIDHKLIKALRAKDDMARWSVQQWRDILTED